MAWGQGPAGWGTAGSDAPQFSVTDQEVITAVLLSLLEPTSTLLGDYTLIATQAGTTMNYVLTSNIPGMPLTSSFSIPVNPMPDVVDVGVAFQITHPTNLVINGSPSADFLVFYNAGSGGQGGIAAFEASITSDYSLGGSQIYSGSESDPTMLAGTFALTPFEPATLTPTGSGIWSPAQIIQYVNDRQRKFLSESGVSVMVAYQAGQALQSRYAVPQNVIDIRRVAWASESSPTTYIELPRADGWELDHGRSGWPTKQAKSPSVYMEDHQPSLTIELNPSPTDSGELELIATAQGEQVDGSGILLSVPDDYTPYLAWGVRADMLAGEYEGNDPIRAAHCEQRFAEGIELARIMTGEL